MDAPIDKKIVQPAEVLNEQMIRPSPVGLQNIFIHIKIFAYFENVKYHTYFLFIRNNNNKDSANF